MSTIHPTLTAAIEACGGKQLDIAIGVSIFSFENIEAFIEKATAAGFDMLEHWDGDGDDIPIPHDLEPDITLVARAKLSQASGMLDGLIDGDEDDPMGSLLSDALDCVNIAKRALSALEPALEHLRALEPAQLDALLAGDANNVAQRKAALIALHLRDAIHPETKYCSTCGRIMGAAETGGEGPEERVCDSCASK